MTMLYVYGIVDLPSFDGAALNGHDGCQRLSGSVRKLCRRREQSVPPRDRAGAGSVWLHEQVLEALMRRHAVVPLRFGTIVADAGMLRSHLSADASARLPAIFGGCAARSNLRCASPVSVPNVPRCAMLERQSDAAQALPPGTRYLRARAERRRHRIACEDSGQEHRTRAEAASRPAAGSAAWGPRYGTIRPWSHPIWCAQGRLGIRRGSRRRSRASSGAQVSCTGPWAPYSFVTVRPPEAWR